MRPSSAAVQRGRRFPKAKESTIMKKLVSLCLMLSAAYAFGQLQTATGTRLADYTSWFGAFAVASDANHPGDPSPPHSLPATDLPIWNGWSQNWGLTGLNLIGKITGTNPDPHYGLRVEYIFLGETAGWRNTWGYRLNDGGDTAIASNIQAAGSLANIKFGDYDDSVILKYGETLDFFFTGVGSTGGKYYVFDPSDNMPTSATMQSYYGTLAPDPDMQPFTIIAFEDIRLGASGCDSDYNDFIFAYRAFDDIIQGPVPEPSTYGLFAAMLLIFLAEYRRRKA
ncbi:MAG: hypothetical protein QM691_10345 [Opitutaceae bacterium]